MPMHPQFTAWQRRRTRASRASQCHIGEGARALVHAKLAGVRQLVHVSTNSFPRPDPAGRRHAAGARDLRHTAIAGRASGDRIRVIREYADDEANIGDGDDAADARRRAGRPTRPDARFTGTPTRRSGRVRRDRRRAADDSLVQVTEKGQVKEYLADGPTEKRCRRTARTMDCVDCHNARRTRSRRPEKAVDRAIAPRRSAGTCRSSGVKASGCSRRRYPDQEAPACARSTRVSETFYESKEGDPVDEGRGTDGGGVAGPLSP